MYAGDASTAEQRALRTSIWVTIGFAVISVIWGLLARSEVILLDAIANPLLLLMTLGSLIVSRVVARGPTRMYPFGRNALAPLVVMGRRSSLSACLYTPSSRLSE